MTFKPIPIFNDGDVADRDRLNDIISNLNELNENRIEMKYDTPELISTRNLKIVAGRVRVPPGRASETLRIDLGSFFDSNSGRPVVNATLVNNNAKRVYLSIGNVAANSFDITAVSASGDPFGSDSFINWIAMGF